MPTDIPTWANVQSRKVVGHGIRHPMPTGSSSASAVQSKALRSQTAAQSHNVFRPDIFRVSEGYLN